MKTLVVGAVLAILGAFNAGCSMSCPTALAEGVLVADANSLVLRATTGETNAIAWDSGTWVREDGGKLALVDWLGGVKAREATTSRWVVAWALTTSSTRADPSS